MLKKYLNREAVFITLFCIVVLLFLQIFITSPMWENENLHRGFEIIGSTIVIIFCLLFTLIKNDWEYNMSGLIYGFLMMGMIDLIHGFSSAGSVFVFLHSIAGVFGGLGVLATILIFKFNMKIRLSLMGLIYSSFFAVLIGTLIIVFKDYMPIMIMDNTFTQSSILINLFAGFLFLLGAIYFYIRLLEMNNKINNILYLSTLLMGMSYITFQFSGIWTTSWWLLHILRLVAYISLIIIIILLLEESREALSLKNKQNIEINSKLNDYTYTISHDLKEPIRSIRTFSDYLLEDYAENLDDTGKDYLNRITRAANKMATMIDDLLILSKVGKVDIEFKEISLNSLVAEVESELLTINENSNVVLRYNKLPKIYCQPLWMKMVLTNLIGNSVKYRDRDKVTTEIRISMAEDKKNSNYYKISISDNGIGIEASQHEKIFGLFRRAYSRNDKEGSGAGLAIVKSIVQEHGGNIWVEKSELGVGTEICFTIQKKRS